MKNIDRSLFRSLKNYQKMKVEKKERESNFLNINADINNVNIYEDSKIDIYNEKELERKIKLTKWVQFKNEGYNNVFNKDASRQNTKIIFSFLGFLASFSAARRSRLFISIRPQRSGDKSANSPNIPFPSGYCLPAYGKSSGSKERLRPVLLSQALSYSKE